MGANAAGHPTDPLPPGLAEHPDYEIVRELGQGGMGTVYLALNRLMGRHEVLKVVSGHLIKRSGVLDRFLVEIRNAARLHHTNVVTAYSASRLGDSIMFAMEYVEGLDLSRLVKAKGPLPVANACHYVYQAALGLQHAHDNGMVHRDIKPSNLMLASRGNRALIKVLDFGLAKVHSEGSLDSGLTHEGQMLGTPDYIAPEQIRDARGADIRADIYSLGCTLYYLLTGGPPFPATSLYELLQAHHSMDAMPLNLARPEVPGQLAALVARMMAKEPGDRFQTPAAVAQALTPFFKQTPAKAKADGLAWESLIATREPETPNDSASPTTSRPEPMPAPGVFRRPPWMTWPLVAAASVLGLIMLGVIIVITTSKGTVKVDLGEMKSATKIQVDDIVISSETTDRPKPKTPQKRAASRSPDPKRDDGSSTWQAANHVVDRSLGTITNGSFRQTTNPAEFDALLSPFNSDLSLSTRAVGTGGLAIVEHLGRTGVLRTHPVDRAVPCVLNAQLEVPRDEKTKLLLDVAHDARGDWQLIVKGNGKPLHDSIVGRSGRGDSWRTITVDLTPFAGKAVHLELLNKANGWSYEFGFWGRIAIVSEKNPPGSHAVARKTPAPDPVPVGSSWVGRRRFPAGNEQICELKITSRNKGHFRGEMVLLNVHDRSHFLTVKVEGDIVRQTIQFRSEQKGAFQQNFVGTLRNQQMHLEFSGVATSGKPTQGEAILTQER